jgi:hypothetical protein
MTCTFRDAAPEWAALSDLTTRASRAFAHRGGRAAGVAALPLSPAAREAAEGCAAAALLRAVERQPGGFLFAPTEETRRAAIGGAYSALRRADRSPSRAILDGGGSSADAPARFSAEAAAGLIAHGATEADYREARANLRHALRMVSVDDRNALRAARRGIRLPGLSRSQSNRRIASARAAIAEAIRARSIA